MVLEQDNGSTCNDIFMRAVVARYNYTLNVKKECSAYQ